MKITTPDEMISGSSKAEEALSKFEEKFKEEEKDQKYYHLVIVGEYSRKTCEDIERLYEKAGWRIARCKTSSENNERPGLTGLQLWI